MKVALVSTGLGTVWRGYERFIDELFHVLKSEQIDVTLFKGAGKPARDEVVLPHFSRDGVLSKFSIFREPKGPYYFETLSFFVFLLPRLISQSFDIVHFTDCPLANFFYHVRNKLNWKFHFKTIFTNGNPISDGACHRVDYLHQLTPEQEKLMNEIGVLPEKIFTIPFGIHVDQFQYSKDRNLLRAKYGVPQDKKVILSVAAINRSHKRVDYLIREAARLGPSYYLFVAGHREDASLEQMARELLGNRFQFRHLPFEQANELYQMADVFTLCSLVEGFGLALVEAMSSKIPVVVHDSEHYKWMVASAHSLTDLSREGSLALNIEFLMKHPEISSEIVRLNFENVFRRFNWAFLKEAYLDMYQKISGQINLEKPACKI